MIRKLILGVLLNAISFYVAAEVVPEMTYEGGIILLLLTGAILGLLNTFLKPIIKVFSFPLIFLTGGLFLIVINAGLLCFVKALYNVLAIDGFAIGFETTLSYFLAGAVLGVINWIEHWLFKT